MWLIKLLRWLLVFIISTAFVLLLISTTVSFSFAEITKPENVKPILYSVFASSMPEEQDFSKMQVPINYECENKTELQLPLGESNDTITINCDDIRNNKPLKEAIFDSLFNKIYYKDYGCSFLQCFEKSNKNEPPLFIFSKSANDFFTKLSVKIIIAAIIAGIALILLGGIRKVANSLITAGLPFIILLLTRNSMMQQISSSKNLQPLLPLITSLDALSTKLFASFLIAGILLLVVSFIFRKAFLRKKALGKKTKPKEEKAVEKPKPKAKREKKPGKQARKK
jgi:hypothetical protein